MAHEVKVKLPKYEVANADIVITVFEDTTHRNVDDPSKGKLGALHISKGTVDWYPKGVSKRKKSKSWREFAELMETR